MDGPDADGPALELRTGHPAAGLLYEERFAEGSIALWRPEAPDIGTLTQTTGAKAFHCSDAAAGGVSWSAPLAAVRDLRLAACFSATGSTCGVVLRQGAQSIASPAAIRVQWSPASTSTPAASLKVIQTRLDDKGAAVTDTTVLQAPPNSEKTIWLEVIAVGPTLVVFANRRLAGIHADKKPQAGRCGVFAAGAGTISFTQFRVDGADASVVRSMYEGISLPAAAPVPGPAPEPTATSPAPAPGPVAKWSLADLPLADVVAGLPGSSGYIATVPMASPPKPQRIELANASDVLALDSTLALPPVDPGDNPAHDLLFCVSVHVPEKGSVGVAVGWSGPDDCVILSLCADDSAPRLVRRTGGVVTILQPNSPKLATLTWIQVAIRIGRQGWTFWVDGMAAGNCDAVAESGTSIALFAVNATKAAFANLALFDLTPRVGPWLPLAAAPQAGNDWLCRPTTDWTWREGALVRGGTGPGTAQTVVCGEAWWADFVLDLTLRRGAAPAGGLVLGYRNAGTFLKITISDDHTDLEVLVDGKVTASKVAPAGWKAGANPLPIRIVQAAGELRLRLGSTQAFRFAADPGRCGVFSTAAGSCSVESWSVRPVTPSDFAEWETADGGAHLDDWEVTSPEGAQEGPARWLRDGDAIVQQSNVWGNATVSGASEFPGTVLWAKKAFGDRYRLCVDLMSSDNDGIGLVLASADKSEWYRFSMHAEQGKRLLVLKAGDVYTEVWSAPVGYVPDAWYRLVLTVSDEGLRGWIDGAPMFWLPDVAKPLPRIGLYAYAEQDARFRNFVVSELSSDRRPRLMRDTFHWPNSTLWTADDPAAWAWEKVRVSGAAAAGQTTRLVGAKQAWAGYRVTANLVRTSLDGTVAICFACETTGELRLVFGPEGTGARLVQVAISATGAATDNQVAGIQGPGAAVDFPTTVTIDCFGRAVLISVNGVAIGSALLPKPVKGGVALQLTDGAAADFRAIVVEPARWHTVVPGLGPLATLEGASAVAAIAPSVLEAMSSPTVWLPAVARGVFGRQGPVKLRVRLPDATTAHEAWRTAESASPTAARQLRSLDGSCVALVEPTKDAWLSDPAVVAVAWQRAPKVPDVQPATQGGDAEPELALIRLDA